MRSKRVIAAIAGGIVGVLLALAVCGVFRANASSLGTLTFATPLKAEGSTWVVDVDLGEGFTGGVGTDLSGTTATYSGTNDPTWTTAAAGTTGTGIWLNRVSGKTARETATSNYAVALLPWIKHSSKASVDFQNITTTSSVGLIMGTNAAGTTGVATRIYWNGSNYQLDIRNITGGGTSTSCTSGASVGGFGVFAITDFTYNPGAAGDDASVTVTRSSGSPATTTVTCEPSGAAGSYAGLISYTPRPCLLIPVRLAADRISARCVVLLAHASSMHSSPALPAEPGSVAP